MGYEQKRHRQSAVTPLRRLPKVSREGIKHGWKLRKGQRIQYHDIEKHGENLGATVMEPCKGKVGEMVHILNEKGTELYIAQSQMLIAGI